MSPVEGCQRNRDLATNLADGAALALVVVAAAAVAAAVAVHGA